MEYTVGQLAKLSGLTTRTLRYYDQIDLLKPSKLRSNGYRIYTEAEVDKLQQILFFRTLEMSPEAIKTILEFAGYDAQNALEEHLETLYRRKDRLEQLIANAKKTIASMKGESKMTDKEKFEGFKKKLLEENQEKYGKELMEKYGEKQIKKSNEKFAKLTQEQYEAAEELAGRFAQTLKEAALTGNPACEAAREACRLHREWLGFFWTDHAIKPQAHINLAAMYCSDPRFQENMEAIAEGRAEFFKEALEIYYEV